MRTSFRLLGCLLALAGGAAAHDPGLSSSSVTLHPGRIELVLQLANADAALAVTGLDSDGDGAVGADEVRGGGAALASFVASGFAADGAKFRLVDHTLEANRDLRVEVEIPVAGTKELTFRWLERLPRAHRDYVLVRDGAGKTLAEELLDPARRSLALPAADGPEPASVSFLPLGVEHVLTGYDHVLFLLALLLTARGLRSACAVVTAFTVAHSLTLALATLDVVRLPSLLVETVIALSIVWVGVENLLVSEPRARWRCTFLFGLVHGFGFASVLQELGIATGPRGVVLPLLEFNLGVELGQLAVALVAVPLFARLRERLRVPGSWLVVAAGAWWSVTRLLQ